jgi:hypothetical protein
MKRMLVFDDTTTGHDRFSMLYQGFNAGGQLRYVQTVKTMQVTRLEGKLLDKLDAVSDAAPADLPNALIMRALKTGEGEQRVSLDEPEYDLLKGHIEHAAGAWAPIASRQVIALVDWLAAIPQVDEKA